MDGHHLPPVGKGVVLKGVDDLDPGVGHHQIAGAVGLHHPVKASLYLFFAGDIHVDGDGGQALSGKLPGQVLGGRQVHIGDHHAIALPRHALSAGPSDTGGRAGDQCGFHRSSSFICHMQNL